MEDERNTQYHQSGESQEKAADQQVEVKERGLLDTLLGRKKPEEDQEKKQEEALVSGMENVKVSEPEKHDVSKEEHHEGGEKKESLLAKLHRTGSSSSSSSDEEEEVIDENGEVVKRKKKKGLKEKIKEKLPGHKDHDVEAEHKPYVPPPAPASVETHAYKEEDDHKAYIPAPVPAPVTTTHVHHHDNAVVVQKVEETPEQGLLDKIKEKLPGGHKKPEDASAYTPAPSPAPVTTTHVHHDDNAVVVQKAEETPEKGLLDKIKEKLPGGHHKKPEDASAAHLPAAHAEDVGSPDGKDKKQGLLGKIMDKIPGYNKSPAEEEHNKPSAAGEHKTSS